MKARNFRELRAWKINDPEVIDDEDTFYSRKLEDVQNEG